MKFHASRLDFRQVKYVVDQGKQVPPCAEHPIKRLKLVLSLQVSCIFAQDLGKADDGIQRGAQFVAHVGQELRFVLTRLLKLFAFLLNVAE